MDEDTIRERLVEASGKYAYNREKYLSTDAPEDKEHCAEMYKWEATEKELRAWLDSIIKRK